MVPSCPPAPDGTTRPLLIAPSRRYRTYCRGFGAFTLAVAVYSCAYADGTWKSWFWALLPAALGAFLFVNAWPALHHLRLDRDGLSFRYVLSVRQIPWRMVGSIEETVQQQGGSNRAGISVETLPGSGIRSMFISDFYDLNRPALVALMQDYWKLH